MVRSILTNTASPEYKNGKGKARVSIEFARLRLE